MESLASERRDSEAESIDGRPPSSVLRSLTARACPQGQVGRCTDCQLLTRAETVTVRPWRRRARKGAAAARAHGIALQTTSIRSFQVEPVPQVNRGQHTGQGNSV